MYLSTIPLMLHFLYRNCMYKVWLFIEYNLYSKSQYLHVVLVVVVVLMLFFGLLNTFVCLYPTQHFIYVRQRKMNKSFCTQAHAHITIGAKSIFNECLWCLSDIVMLFVFITLIIMGLYWYRYCGLLYTAI